MARALSLSGTAPMRVYFYNHTLALTLASSEPWRGCYHSSELCMVMDATVCLTTSSEVTLMQAFVRYQQPYAPSLQESESRDLFVQVLDVFC